MDREKLIRKWIFIFILMLFPGWMYGQDWKTDIDEALRIASEKDRHIILVFQGSDWCAPCMKLDREIWSTEEFKSYAADHYIMLKADFPRKKSNALSSEQQEKNNQLAEKYNKRGYFPLIVVLDKKGTVLGQTGYKHISVSDYIAVLNSF